MGARDLGLAPGNTSTDSSNSSDIFLAILPVCPLMVSQQTQLRGGPHTSGEARQLAPGHPGSSLPLLFCDPRGSDLIFGTTYLLPTVLSQSGTIPEMSTSSTSSAVRPSASCRMASAARRASWSGRLSSAPSNTWTRLWGFNSISLRKKRTDSKR